MPYSIVDLIKIPGTTGTKPEDIEESLFESLQGAGVTFSAQEGAPPISVSIGGGSGGGTLQVSIPQPLAVSVEDTAVPAVIWAAQTASLVSQSTLIQAVKDALTVKASKLPTQDGIVDYLLDQYKEHLDEALQGELVSYAYNPIAGTVADFIVVCAAEAVAFLKGFYAASVSACDAMLSENTAITPQEPDDPAQISHVKIEFDRRETMLNRHAQQVADILNSANMQEVLIAQPRNETWNGSWKEWIQDVEGNLGTLQTWLDEHSTELEEYISNNPDGSGTDSSILENLPVPTNPGLPDKPPSDHPLVIVLYYIVKVGIIYYKIKRLIDLFRGRKETEASDKLLQALQDLKFNEMEFNLPNSSAKFNLFSNAVRYGGKTGGSS